MLQGFKPIIGTNPRVLILGSMPSVTSLSKNEYYGFAHNRFWKFMSQIFACELPTYEDKKTLIENNSIILWDVIQSCEREGSLDSAIRHEVVNDIDSLVKDYPSLSYVVCNGKKAYDLYQKHFSHIALPCISLPSTSNANRTIKEEELFEEWKKTVEMVLK